MNGSFKFSSLPLLGIFLTLMVIAPTKCDVQQDVINFYLNKKNILEVMIAYLSSGEEDHLCCYKLLGYGAEFVAEIEFIHFPHMPELKFPAVACLNIDADNYDAYFILAIVEGAYKYVRLDVSNQQQFMGSVYSIVTTYPYDGSTNLGSLTRNYFNNCTMKDKTKGALIGRLILVEKVCRAFEGGAAVGYHTVEMRDITVGNYQLPQVWTTLCTSGFRIAYVNLDFNIFMILDKSNNFANIMKSGLDHKIIDFI